MAWPDTPREMIYELYLGAFGWVDVTSYVFDRAPVTITRGRGDTASEPEPCNCSLTFNNDSGNLSPDNPVGIYYGILGENTPLRVTLRRSGDTFSRVVANGWGSNDGGQEAWTVDAPASGWSTNGSVGQLSLAAANTYKSAALLAAVLRDLDVTITVTVPVTDITGDWLRFGIYLRAQSGTDYYYLPIEITTAEAVRIGAFHFSGTTVVAMTTVAGLTHTSAQALTLRVQAEAHTLRAKVWAASGVEPYDWQIEGHTSTLIGAGYVGLFGWASAGNTNTKPLVLSYDNMVIRLPRYAGELSDLRVRWDPSEADVFTVVTAQGIRRRLGQGASPLLGAARRRINYILGTSVGQPYIKNWWPLEDAREVSVVEEVIGGTVRPVSILGGSGSGEVSFGGSSDAPGAPLAVTVSQSGIVFLNVTPGAVTNAWGVALTAMCPAGKAGTFYFTASGLNSGELFNIRLVIGADGVAYVLRSISGVGGIEDIIISHTVHAGGWGDNEWHHYIVTCHQSGANAVFTLWVDGTQVGTQTTNSVTVRAVHTIQLYCGTPYVGPMSVSHVVLLTGAPSSWHVDTADAISDACLGHRGERAGDRMLRLCAEQGISFSYVGELSETATMGPQPTEKFLTIFDECAKADLGTQFEPRGRLGLSYRTRASMHTQPVVLDLDYSAQEVAPPFEPSTDDTYLRNDIRVARVNGSAPARAQLLTGRRSVLPPEQGGAGRYDDSRTLNVYADDQLLGIAYWLLALFTVLGPRFPQITVDLSSTEILAGGKEIAALTVDIDDHLTVSNPFAKFAPDQIAQHARGTVEVIRNFTHMLTFNCAPQSPYRIAVVGQSGHKVDAANSSLSGGPYSSSATSLTVTSAEPGGPWITGAVSIDIMVAGEEMLVTNIANAASPQVFTVQRSRNGVVKAQVNGTRVRLARPVKVGLGS